MLCRPWPGTGQRSSQSCMFLLGVRPVREALAQPCGLQRAGLLEDRVGDRADVRVDALEVVDDVQVQRAGLDRLQGLAGEAPQVGVDRKSTRLNSSHSQISYAVFC